MPRFLPAPQYMREHCHRGSADGLSEAKPIDRAAVWSVRRGTSMMGFAAPNPSYACYAYRARRMRKLSSCPRAQGLARGTFQTPDYAGGRIVKFNLTANTCLGND